MLHSNGFRIDRVTTNRVKPISWLYAPSAPLAWLLSTLTFRKELDDASARARGREILRVMFSHDVLFGESLVVRAVKR